MILNYAQLPRLTNTLVNVDVHDAHGTATKDTLARWIRSILKVSGVNTDTFTAHSCRAASTSKAMSSGVALDVILKAGQWFADSTSYKFYKKSENLVDIEFADSLIH